MEDLSIEVTWNGKNPGNDQHREAAEGYARSIQEYINRFNQLPPKGLFIETKGMVEPGEIWGISFDGWSGRITVHLTLGNW